MAQEKITINGTEIRQPDEGLQFNFETTYTEDSTRVQSGTGHFTPMFTVESFGYSASWLTAEEVSTILQMVAKGKNFTLHYFSPYYGAWRSDTFYVGQGSLEIGRLNTDRERFDSLSFNMVGVNPI
ncbi:MAG: hypothetical protein LUC30_10340 [Clostridiales bacterium]|nr:hypothetical protein [Clostridiales bacterium]